MYKIQQLVRNHGVYMILKRVHSVDAYTYVLLSQLSQTMSACPQNLGYNIELKSTKHHSSETYQNTKLFTRALTHKPYHWLVSQTTAITLIISITTALISSYQYYTRYGICRWPTVSSSILLHLENLWLPDLFPKGQG